MTRQQGYRGASPEARPRQRLGRASSPTIKSLSDISPWRMAVVLESNDQSARIGFQPGRELGGAISKQRRDRHRHAGRREVGEAVVRPSTRARTPTSVAQVLQPGDVIYADPLFSKDGKAVEGQYRLRQIPEGVGRDGGDGPAHRPCAGDGRRLLVRPEPVQPRDPGLPAARLDLQADRLFDGARQRLYADRP